jgi:excisionase family DNA binding protein
MKKSGLRCLALSPAEASEAVGVSESLIRKEIRLGKLPAYKVGRRTLVIEEELRNWLLREPAKHSVKTPSSHQRPAREPQPAPRVH